MGHGPLIETSAALGGCLLGLAVAIVLDRRPYRPGKRNYLARSTRYAASESRTRMPAKAPVCSPTE